MEPITIAEAMRISPLSRLLARSDLMQEGIRPLWLRADAPASLPAFPSHEAIVGEDGIDDLSWERYLVQRERGRA